MSDLKQDCTCLSTERDPLRHEPDCQHRANELAALRARHEKLRELVKAYLRRTLTGNERKELNALLEDE